MTKYVVREWVELISDPISFGERDQRVFKHSELPTMNNKLSVTLRLKIRSHGSSWAAIFRKSEKVTPSLWLTAKKSGLHPRFTGNWKFNIGIDELGDGLLLNKWYHLTYTLSDPEKRLDFYIDGDWAGFYSIQHVKTQKVIFNDGPLYVGQSYHDNGFDGEISNFRYFNWRLSAEEVKEDFFNEFQKKPIVYGSKVALVHVSTRKYLSTKGIKYDFGPQNQQYMIICNGQEIDLINDVWTIIGANGTSVSAGDHISLNTIIGFKHQATGYNLHSHDTSYEKFTPISKHQQVTLYRDINGDNDWLIRRYNQTASYDGSGHLMNGDIIGLFHINTNKPALYSHNILLGDGTQEVSCYGDGDEKNKWRIELID
ncbi:concanavalin A-like lectin/glucanase domain-containing protein [Glomus cerebriforme]|uniref:Concanavalin A-like lectin/glucanase domain-containing protein n=1 Tax=Glomus cerebriforme TaxID=658196 RepID=A0A397SUD2_9GLOM|nr:concanavalin A-like lectin/glucanase domain-containing protein [Glomus cerebriforme]